MERQSKYKFGILLVKNPSNRLLDHIIKGIAVFYYLISSIGVLLVFDITNRDSFHNVSKWYHEINDQAASNCSIVLVGNKTDLEQQYKILQF